MHCERLLLACENYCILLVIFGTVYYTFLSMSLISFILIIDIWSLKLELATWIMDTRRTV